MSLRRKFYFAFSLIASLAIGLAVYGVRALSATGGLVVRLYDEPLIGVSYARAASASLNEARGFMVRNLLLEPVLRLAAVASLQRLHTDIAEDLAIVRQRVHDADVTNALDRAQNSITDWFADGQRILVPSVDGVTSLPMPTAVQRRGAAATASLDDLVELVTARGFAYRARAEAEIRASSATLAGLSAGIIAISGLFALLFGHLLIRPIRAAIRIAEDVAAGNVANFAATPRRDEIGRLLTCLVTMQATLQSRAAHALALLRERERTTETLRLTNVRFDSALNNMTHGLLMYDNDSRVVVVNRQFCEIYGIDPAQVHPGTTYRELLALSMAAGEYPGRTVDEVLAEHAPMLQSRQRATVIGTLPGGRTTAISYEPMADGGWIATHEDITERRRSEAQVAFLAQHDWLTELPNRALFHERLKQAFARARRGEEFALLSLDLDQFKVINDTLGHPIGDSLLRTVAARLRQAVRGDDTVARVGGDEFMILQLGVSGPADPADLARRIVRAVGEPFELDGHRVVVGTSIGIALSPGDGADPERLLKHADLALYRAKRNGPHSWYFFEPAMDTLAQARRALELDLRSPTLLQQLELHYQPVVCSRTRQVTGFEALLRWHHPIRGAVPPDEFIPVAEEIGLIVQIGAWVLQQACAEAATWPDHLRVAVNLSPVQFRSNMLQSTVADALKSSGIAPERLGLEITESVLLEENQANLSKLHAMHALGARIALDDFGTGYSSLSYLRSFPFDTIKIDRSFVSDLQKREECVAIVRAVTGLGRSLRMKTIAEGVETEEQFAILAAEGCTEIQGYLFSKPVPAAALPALIARLSEPQALALPALFAVSA